MLYLLTLLGADSLFYKWASGLGDGGYGAKTAAFIVSFTVIAVAGYLLGSLNSAVMVSKYKYHQDIRDFGSGNAGLTNMYRVYGKGGALLTLAGDVIKQVIAVAIGILFVGEYGAYVAGLFCILGHMFPFWMQFRGGKGFASLLGFSLGADWRMFLACIVLLGILLFSTRYIALATVSCAVLVPVWHLVRTKDWPEFAVLAVLSVIIIVKHIPNIRRIRAGTEIPLGKKKKQEPAEASAEQ